MRSALDSSAPLLPGLDAPITLSVSPPDASSSPPPAPPAKETVGPEPLTILPGRCIPPTQPPLPSAVLVNCSALLPATATAAAAVRLALVLPANDTTLPPKLAPPGGLTDTMLRAAPLATLPAQLPSVSCCCCMSRFRLLVFVELKLWM